MIDGKDKNSNTLPRQGLGIFPYKEFAEKHNK